MTQQESLDAERREKLRLIVEHAAQTGLALYDANSQALLYASPLYLDVARRLMERAGGATDADRDVLTRRWDELPFGDQQDIMTSAFRDAVQGGQPVRVREWRLLAPDGTESVWNCSLIPVLYARGEMQEGVRYVCISCIEVTEPVREREGMARLDRMKNEFLSMASHELRTPLMPLTAYADVLSRLVHEPKQKEIVDKLQQQLRYMTRLTDDLLDVARMETGTLRLEREPVDLARVVQAAADQARHVATKPAIRMSLEVDGGLLTKGDEGRLVRAIFNLLSNALTHAAETDFVEARLARSSNGRLGEYAVIEITDHGPDLPDEEREHIFDHFFQLPARKSSRKGLGLGLYICRSIVEQHGGTIEVDGVRPHGTRFRVKLPLAAPEA